MHRLLSACCVLPLLGGALCAQTQYKRVHQEALRHVLRGNVESALVELDEFALEWPEDAETWFLRGLALGSEARWDEALAAHERALELGLPLGRVFAEPRELLAPLAQRLPAAPRLVHGPMLGDLRAHGLRVWLRTARAAEVELAAYALGASGPAATARARSAADADFALVLELEGLAPSSEYRVDVHVDGEAAHSLRCTTAPLAGSAGAFSLVFGGGAGYVPAHEHAWTTIGALEPDLMLLLGDNVYSDDPTSPAMQRYCYARRQSRPEWRELVEGVPVYAIWDDHDFGTNDCWGGPELDEPAWKLPVWELFRQSWANPSYGGGPERPGCWFSFTRGDVDFFLLDGRMYRSDPRLPEPSMLGPEQNAWLREALRESSATFKLICSPVPFEYRTKGASKDTWNGFRDEREALFDFLAQEAIEGVVLVSADRHRSDAWRIEREGAYDLYEFNSSKLTNQHTHRTMDAALFSYNAKQSFGRLLFDTDRPDPVIRYEVWNIDGERVHELELRRSQLR